MPTNASSKMDVLNKPIVIWALTSLLIGEWPTLYAKYDTCWKTHESDVVMSRKLNTEFRFRSKKSIKSFIDANHDKYKISQAIEGLEHPGPYIFDEFAKKTFWEINFDIYNARSGSGANFSFVYSMYLLVLFCKCVCKRRCR